MPHSSSMELHYFKRILNGHHSHYMKGLNLMAMVQRNESLKTLTTTLRHIGSIAQPKARISRQVIYWET